MLTIQDEGLDYGDLFAELADKHGATLAGEVLAIVYHHRESAQQVLEL